MADYTGNNIELKLFVRDLAAPAIAVASFCTDNGFQPHKRCVSEILSGLEPDIHRLCHEWRGACTATSGSDIPLHEPTMLPFTHAYVLPHAADAGEEVEVFVSSDVSYSVSLVQVGQHMTDSSHDRVLYTVRGEAKQQPLFVGSYGHVSWTHPRAAIAAEASISAWVYLVQSHQIRDRRRQAILALQAADGACLLCVFIDRVKDSHFGVELSLVVRTISAEVSGDYNEPVKAGSNLGRWVHIAAVATGQPTRPCLYTCLRSCPRTCPYIHLCSHLHSCHMWSIQGYPSQAP